MTVLRPVTKLVIAGGGPIAEAIARAADLLGWRVLVSDDVNEAVGQVTALSALDNLVVIGHDDRLTGAALEAALAGPVGYIGSVGPASPPGLARRLAGPPRRRGPRPHPRARRARHRRPDPRRDRGVCSRGGARRPCVDSWRRRGRRAKEARHG